MKSLWNHPWIFPALEEGAVNCFGVFLHGDFEDWRRLCRGSVTTAEWDHATSFVQAADAARHLVGRAMVRRVLAQEMNEAAARANFSTNAFGKPYLEGGRLAFNIAHSGRMVWAAFCQDAAVGIDVEVVDPAIDPFALLLALHPDERAVIGDLPPEAARHAFYRTWVRKEAFIKALGCGLSCPPEDFSVHAGAFPRCQWLQQLPETAPADWTSADIQTPTDYYASVAMQKTGGAVRTFLLNELGSHLLRGFS